MYKLNTLIIVITLYAFPGILLLANQDEDSIKFEKQWTT